MGKEKYAPGKHIEYGSFKWVSDNLLKCETDFMWYKKKIDVTARHEFNHQGVPEKYPCIVFSDCDSELHSYSHTFIYKEKRKCEACGHVVYEWPEEDAIKDILGL